MAQAAADFARDDVQNFIPPEHVILTSKWLPLLLIAGYASAAGYFYFADKLFSARRKLNK